MNKKFSVVAVLGVLALVGAGCSSTSTTSGDTSATTNTVTKPAVVSNSGAAQDKLDGKWKVTSATGDMASLNEGTPYTFVGKSKLTTGSGILANSGDITAITDTTFSVMFAGMSNASNYNYHFDGAKLVIEPQGSNQVLTLEKQ
ncbi:MAG: hypothetical protein COU28_04055 [Candidatus Magasanikbacteria bacterium CG10_big_fil_rev_8_21_14_0_10_36_16]|uniref:DUF306 domain-containing protein n=1 Tax=Candidatus Magasanikbacteria bacterium CG10_big_fil_rev_8_21_14_0_10_36_16 TaxID=1974645 RepID=A0A2H0TZW6_9BACT|nr:MAG: hypothetical protein COU28_04055 [Candidatus Magasanikbacteria bacterium CG10_big_fil_rev_8_21_14_0_10_36_16]